LEVLCIEIGCKSVIHVPRTLSVRELKEEACAELFVVSEDVDLYDFFGGQCYACLEDRLDSSLSDVRLMDRQAVLLKGRHNTPPALLSPIINTLFQTKPPDVALQLSDGTIIPVHRWILELSSTLLQDVLTHCPTPDEQRTEACGPDQQPLTVIPVPGDDRLAWVFALKLLYPVSQMRRPPITWSNIDRILALADKWNMSSVMKVCEDFLLLPTTTFSLSESDPSCVWTWLIKADRLSMTSVMRKCIATIVTSKMSSARGMATTGPGSKNFDSDDPQLDKMVKEVAVSCSPNTLTSLISALIVCKDRLQASQR